MCIGIRSASSLFLYIVTFSNAYKNFLKLPYDFTFSYSFFTSSYILNAYSLKYSLAVYIFKVISSKIASLTGLPSIFSDTDSLNIDIPASSNFCDSSFSLLFKVIPILGASVSIFTNDFISSK